MRVVAWTAVALALCALAHGADASAVDQFANFKAHFGRKYTTAEEEAKRFRIFSANMEKAAALQASNPHAKFGANEFADMSESEFKTRHNADKYYAERAKESRTIPTETVTAAQKAKAAGSKVDWRQSGAVTPVKNQGQCGSCWSFSTTGGIEGQWFLSGNPLVSLSEQEFVSCDTTDSGCKGGLMDNAFQWILNTHNGTLVTEESYPYVSGEGVVPTCNMTSKVNAAQIVGFSNIEHNEDAMAAWVLTHGPLSIAVDASAWQMYTGGVMTNCMGLSLDHGVLIVGFDDTYNPPYWIVKNSWGPIWGEQGYIRVEKGNDQCLISQSPCTSKVTSVGPTPNPGPTADPEPTPPSGTVPPVKPFPQGWVDLMSPPWTDGPQLAFGISCISGNDCYIVGGSNGAGFGAFHFDGNWNGYFRHVNQQQESGMDMLMAVAVGGPAATPSGAVGGMDFGAQPQYFTEKYMLNNSISVPFVVTQYISADRATGKNVLFADGFDGNVNDMWFSTNGGESYTGKKITSSVIDKNCSFANAQVVVDANTWYVVAGGNPAPPPSNPPPPPFAAGSQQEAKPAASTCKRNLGFEALLEGDVTVLHRKSQFHAIVRDNKDGKIRHAFVDIPKYIKAQETAPLQETGCPFVATIYKTTDGGNSWTTSFEQISKGFMMDFIDCANATHCVAVGSGANRSHTPGAHVFTTTDGGNTWVETLNKPFTAESAWFVSGVQFVPGTADVWIAGNMQSANGGFGEFWYSSDAGQTWALKQQMNFIMVITDLAFAADGTGFATALTPLKDTTVLRFTPNGAPQTPAPVWNGNFTQRACPNSGSCGGECVEASFPQNTCLNLTNGFSAQVECDTQDGVLIQRVYPLDRVCWGPAEEQIVPLDRCMVGNPGTLEFTCGPSTNANVKTDAKFTPVRGAIKPVRKH